jgi:GTP-binding protein
MNVEFLTSAFRESQFPSPDIPEIAFAGRSNVGKSSLINILVNRKGLARTSARPGRTQSINFFTVDRRLYFVDLPGYGYARVPIKVKKSWEQMVETYLRRRSNLKAVVVILDIRRDLTSGDQQLLEWLEHYGVRSILVLTKADKLSRQRARARFGVVKGQCGKTSAADPLLFSAKTRQGREVLLKKIEEACSFQPSSRP